jgi:hypothetical protein
MKTVNTYNMPELKRYRERHIAGCFLILCPLRNGFAFFAVKKIREIK